jgi:hypothetical protein
VVYLVFLYVGGVGGVGGVVGVTIIAISSAIIIAIVVIAISSVIIIESSVIIVLSIVVSAVIAPRITICLTPHTTFIIIIVISTILTSTTITSIPVIITIPPLLHGIDHILQGPGYILNHLRTHIIEILMFKTHLLPNTHLSYDLLDKRQTVTLGDKRIPRHPLLQILELPLL